MLYTAPHVSIEAGHNGKSVLNTPLFTFMIDSGIQAALVLLAIFAALEPTWGAVYNIRNDRDPPLLARFSDPKTKPATLRKFVGQCLNCLSDDGHNMRTCPKPFLNKNGLMNNQASYVQEVRWTMFELLV